MKYVLGHYILWIFHALSQGMLNQVVAFRDIFYSSLSLKRFSLGRKKFVVDWRKLDLNIL